MTSCHRGCCEPPPCRGRPPSRGTRWCGQWWIRTVAGLGCSDKVSLEGGSPEACGLGACKKSIHISLKVTDVLGICLLAKQLQHRAPFGQSQTQPSMIQHAWKIGTCILPMSMLVGGLFSNNANQLEHLQQACHHLGEC